MTTRAVSLLSAAALLLALAPAALAAGPTYLQGFETDTGGWFVYTDHTITRQPDAYSNGGGYADGIASSAGTHHARLGRGTCGIEPAGGGDTVYCEGPFTRWGG